MAADLFISYANPDEGVALALFDLLNAHSISCFIAPRSIVPGTIWDDAIVAAIDECRVFVAVLSTASEQSGPMAAEIGLAADQRLPILPIRIVRVKPTKGMRLYLRSPQYLDAFPGALSDHQERIVHVARTLLARPPRPVGVPAATGVSSVHHPPAGAIAAIDDARSLEQAPADPPAAAVETAHVGETVVEAPTAADAETAIGETTDADNAAGPGESGEPATQRATPLLLPPAPPPAPPPVREIVGFDLGHGETAVAKAALDSDAHPTIVALGGKLSQVSAIGHHPERGFVLGEQAILDPEVDAALICFKEPPGRSAMTRQVVTDYLAAYYRWLLDDGHIRGGDESFFFVGCPSGWSRDDIQLYEDTLLKSGISRLKVVKESRAALLNVIKSGGITKDELRANVLIVDLGSSTTDITLVTGATVEAPMDFGLELGAALIDKRILERAVQAHAEPDALSAAFERDATTRDRCEFLCRRVKEEYFSRESLYRRSGRRASAGVENVDGTLTFVPSVDTRLMDTILAEPLPELGDRSWVDAFRSLLLECRARLQEEGCTPAAIVATGGASRMAFVQQICTDVFPDSKFSRDDEPEASIARGLALWGRVYLRTADFEAAVARIADTQIPEIVEHHSAELILRIAKEAGKALVEVAVRPSLESWRAGKLSTIDRIEPAVKGRARKWLEGSEFDKLIGDAVQTWWQPVQPELDDIMDGVCRRYGIPGGSLKINPVLRRVTNPSLSAGDSVSAGVTESMQVALIAVGAALLLLAGPGGWMVSVVGGVLGLESGAEVRKMKIWNSLRPALLSDTRMQACIADTTKKIQGSIRDELKSGPALAEMSGQISEELKSALLERADEARLLIR